MRSPYIRLVPRPLCPLHLAPGLQLYHDARFFEALKYFERLRISQRISTAVFYGVMGFITYGAALPFVGWAMKDTYDPLFQAMAYCQFQLGNDIEAVRLFKKICVKTPVDLVVMGISLWSIGNEIHARAMWGLAVQQDPRMDEWIQDACQRLTVQR